MSESSHRFFIDKSYGACGGHGTEEVGSLQWTTALPYELRYPFDVLNAALPEVRVKGLSFYFTRNADELPEYGRKVVGVLLQDERCKVPIYGRHVRAVIRNLTDKPFMGWKPHLRVGRLEAVETLEYLRNHYLRLRSRARFTDPPKSYPAPIQKRIHVFYLPLGYHRQENIPQVPMAERPLDAFFAGTVTDKESLHGYLRWTSISRIEARQQMWKVLKELEAQGEWHLDLGDHNYNDLASIAVEYSSYSEKMMHSRICLAPRGSVAETFRAFEGLRAGCLVVANPWPKDGYMNPSAPIMMINHWREVEDILKRYARDINALEQWRTRSLAWWDDHLRPESVAPRLAVFLNRSEETLLA